MAVARALACLALLAASLAAHAIPIERRLHGEWVPEGHACRSGIGVRLDKAGVTLVNGARQRTYADIEASDTYWGGQRSDGLVVAVFPRLTGGVADFILHVNHERKVGRAMIEFPAPALREDFPFGERPMRKCRIG